MSSGARAQLGLVVAALLIWLGRSLVWVRASASDVGLPAQEFTLGRLVPVASVLPLVFLSGAVAVYVLHGIARRVVSLVVLGCAALGIAGTYSALTSLDARVEAAAGMPVGEISSTWAPPVVMFLGCALAVVAAVVAWQSREAPRAGRYRRPSDPELAGSQGTGAAGLWEAQDRGEDPTAG